MRRRLQARGIQGGLYVVAAVLINVVAASQFFRIDLTEDRVHTLSAASIAAVSALEEPLTIRAFFTPELRAPFNNIEPAVRDLLDAYARHGGERFNFQFYSMDPKAADAFENEQLARSYLVSPMQIEQLDSNEVTVKSAYLGMAMLHGDLIETIGAITSDSRLEFHVTSAIQSLTTRVSTLLALEEDIAADLYFSGELAPSYSDLAQGVRDAVAELGPSYFGRIALDEIDPSVTPMDPNEAQRLQLLPMALTDGGTGTEQLAYAAVTVTVGERSATVNLFQNTLFGLLPIETAGLQATLDEQLKGLLGSTDRIAYVADFGAPPHRGLTDPNVQPQSTDLRSTYDLLRGDYEITPTSLASAPIPPGAQMALLVSPQESLSDWALFQLDQLLMRGGSLVLFLDSFTSFLADQGGFGGGRTIHIPRDVGIGPLLEHYGLRIEPSYVMDEQGYLQRGRDARGGAVHTEFPNAPSILPAQMATQLPFMRNLTELVMHNASPIVRTEPQPGVTYTDAIVTTPDAWQMRDDIQIDNPSLIVAPPDAERGELALAVLAEGTFTSFFAGREAPQPAPVEGEQEEEASSRQLAADVGTGVPVLVESERPGRLFVVGTTRILEPGFINAQQLNGNTLFLHNLVDYLNDHEARAELRGRGRLVRRLIDAPAAQETAFKTLGIVGPPLIVGLLGLGLWLWWNARKRHIRAMYDRP